MTRVYQGRSRYVLVGFLIYEVSETQFFSFTTLTAGQSFGLSFHLCRPTRHTTMDPERRTLHLPAEIVEKIFRNVRNHHYTLASCARVCQFWLPSSRRYLYARVRIGDFQEYPNTTTRSLRGGLEALRLLLLSSPSLCDYVQRLDIAWTTGLDERSLHSVVTSMPQLRALSLWHSGRRGGSPDRQFLALDDLRHKPSSTGRPVLFARRTWVSLHKEIVTLTPTANTIQPLLDCLSILESTDALYIMTGRKVDLDEELQKNLRFPTCFHELRSLDIAFDSSGWFSARPLNLLLGLLAHSRPRRVRCTRWRYPGHARSLGTLFGTMGSDVEHLHLYLRWFMGMLPDPVSLSYVELNYLWLQEMRGRR